MSKRVKSFIKQNKQHIPQYTKEIHQGTWKVKTSLSSFSVSGIDWSGNHSNIIVIVNNKQLSKESYQDLRGDLIIYTHSIPKKDIGRIKVEDDSYKTISQRLLSLFKKEEVKEIEVCEYDITVFINENKNIKDLNAKERRDEFSRDYYKKEELYVLERQ